MTANLQLLLLASLCLVLMMQAVAQTASSGQQKTAGVPGSPCSPCRNGLDGRDGVKGDVGSKGDKGDGGVPGLRASDGDEEMKGEKGLDGLVGMKGLKGNPGKLGPVGPKGLAGVRGAKGQKGSQGDSVRADDLQKTIESVVEKKIQESNSAMTSKINNRYNELNSALSSKIQQVQQSLSYRPRAHISGDNSNNYYGSGTVTRWYSRWGSVWSPILRDGMRYSNGYITVPVSGEYYVYAQIDYYHTSNEAGYNINVNGRTRASTYRYVHRTGLWHTHYVGRIVSLNRGDTLSLSFYKYSRYYFWSSMSFFGAFKVS